jgi:hypothetical protein
VTCSSFEDFEIFFHIGVNAQILLEEEAIFTLRMTKKMKEKKHKLFVGP